MELYKLQDETKRRLGIEKQFSFLNVQYLNTVLPFNMEHQTQSNWCWAATSKSVSQFYSSATPWTQCKIAGKELNQTCCSSPVPGPCNIPWYLDRALTRTNNFISVNNGAISWERVKQELDNGLVVGARIGWNGGGGHFMVIYGASLGGTTKYLNIDDPIYGKSVLTYDQFANNYQGSGRWTHTYFTKKYNYYMWFKDLVYDLKLLRPISHARPLAIPQEEFAKAGLPAEEYSLPHYTYIIGLDEIKKAHSLPGQANSLRIVEMKGERPKVLYELGLNPENPELMQMNISENYLNQLDEGVAKLKTFAKNTDESGELRFVKIPALNIEAFCLHYDNAEDVFALVKKFENDSNVNWEKAYSENEFFVLLQQLAEKINSDDDMIGS